MMEVFCWGLGIPKPITELTIIKLQNPSQTGGLKYAFISFTQYFSSLFHCVNHICYIFAQLQQLQRFEQENPSDTGELHPLTPNLKTHYRREKIEYPWDPMKRCIFVAYIKYSSPQPHSGHSTCVVILLAALFYKLLKNWLTCVIPLNDRRDIFKDPNVTFHTPLTP